MSNVLMPKYRYAPLKIPNSFRLLRLRQSKQKTEIGDTQGRDPPLEGSIAEFPIQSETPFECLSYTWGEPIFDHAIILDGSLLPITKNLDSALRSAQRAAETSLLWVDAICINQDNLEERAHQVQRMKTIYSSADQVLAFLGYEADGSQHVPSLCARIYQSVEELRKTRPISSELEENIVFSEDVGLPSFPPNDELDWAILTRLLARPWFVRVWIIQEAVMARKLTFMCGEWEMIAELLFYTVHAGAVHSLPLSSWESSERDAARHGIGQILFMIYMIGGRLVP
jgi:Heterokaryon incompatibility protein (HET)